MKAASIKKQKAYGQKYTLSKAASVSFGPYWLSLRKSERLVLPFGKAGNRLPQSIGERYTIQGKRGLKQRQTARNSIYISPSNANLETKLLIC